jgi:UDP-N-acetylmuramate--alanine ligase
MTAAILNQIATGDRPLRLHLIGVAGSGMSGLAGLLLDLGHGVSGSDRVSSDEVRRLAGRGLRFSTPHGAAAVAGTDAVIYSSAVRAGNVAYDAAAAAGIPLVRRAAALAAIMRRRRGIVVAGTHGKTTTTALAAHVLRQAGLHPGHYVGAEIPLLGTNACWDEAGEWFVAEGDESDGTLVEFAPEWAIILNIEEEHLDHYRDLAEIQQVFHTLATRAGGRLIHCADDPGARAVAAAFPAALSYGTAPGATFQIVEAALADGGSRFRIRHGETDLGWFELAVPGRHNILNAAAVIALGTTLGLAPATLREALPGFRGARRRFETRYRSPAFQLVDDYGHHPTEIAATLAAARSLAPRRVLCLFQPHRFSRTTRLRGQFGPAFDEADALWVSDIYAASESPIPGVTGAIVADEVNRHGGPRPRARFIPDLAGGRLALGNALRRGDLAITLGAGNVHECATPLARDLAVAEELAAALAEPDPMVRLYEPMRRHTTLLVGGAAQFWVEPATFEGFARAVRFCRARGLPLRVLGRGSNLLVRDGGLPGVVLHPGRGEFIEITRAGDCLRAGAGVRFKALAAAAREARLGGFEWMEGIPGSVGGGLRMNAGAMGVETFDQVDSVLVANHAGEPEERPRAAFAARYRDTPALAAEFALAATFRGRPATPVAEIDAALEASRAKRRASQPLAASAGCVFKNPPAGPAGRLIDELGLKGTRVGAAEVSAIHGNFIVNLEGKARARDVLALIARLKQCARESRGVHLETEIEITGEDELLF